MKWSNNTDFLNFRVPVVNVAANTRACAHTHMLLERLASIPGLQQDIQEVNNYKHVSPHCSRPVVYAISKFIISHYVSCTIRHHYWDIHHGVTHVMHHTSLSSACLWGTPLVRCSQTSSFLILCIFYSCYLTQMVYCLLSYLDGGWYILQAINLHAHCTFK